MKTSIVKVQLEEQTCLCEVEEMLQSSRSRLECVDQLLGHIFKSFQPREALVSRPGNWWRFHTFEYSIGSRCRRSSSSRRVVHIRRRWADSIHVADESSLWRKHDGVAGRVGLLLGTSWLPQARVGMLQASTTLNLVHIIKAILTDVYMLKHVLVSSYDSSIF